MQAGMAWEQLPWDQRLFALDELSKEERGKLHALIFKTVARDDREQAVPRNRDLAVISLREQLALAEAGICWVAVTCVI